MAEDLEITGATAGSPRYIVAYLDVNTNNLYDANGNLYGNETLATTLGNEFILELHYVQDISTSDNPDNWTPWEGLNGMTVSSTLAFDDNYVHAVEATVAENTVAGYPTVKVNVPEINKDVLSSSGTLVFNPFGIEPEDVQQNETRPVKKIVSYNAFEYISGTVFEFTIEDAQGLPIDVVGGENATPVRVSDPLYLFVGTDTIYENNIPDRYGEGVFKFPMNINSRKLLKALDYSGASGVSGTMEHNIYVERNTLANIVISGNTFSRNSDGDAVAKDLSDDNTYVFCDWTSGSTSYWTRGKDVVAGTPLYTVSGGTATQTGDTATPVYNTDSVLFRTFAFPFIVRNLVDYGNSITIPVENTDWTKDYIISIIRNNMEIVIGKASTATYGTVMVGGSTANIDIDDGVISVKDASTSDKGVVQLVDSISDTTSTDKAVTPNYVKTIADTKQDNLTFDTTTGIEVISGTTVKNDIATVEEVLTGATGTNIVDADNLRGALSVGQAVDVSCTLGGTRSNSVNFEYSIDGGSTWMSFTAFTASNAFLSDFSVRLINGNPAESGVQWLGYHATANGAKFPKFAPGLKYLFLFDARNVGARASDTAGVFGKASGAISGVSRSFPVDKAYTDYTRVACLSEDGGGYFSFYPYASNTTIQMDIKNWRQYEVTALTDEAIAYIAQLPDPDAFFRSTSASSVLNKYLVKQDMVAPWIPTINMPDNSAGLTVGAGLSYKIKYTQTGTYSVSVDTIPTDAYGWDAHIQMFVKDTAIVQFQAPLILMDALTPNAGHNLSVKFRNGNALVYVDDTNAGTMVYLATGTTTDVGSLPYALSQTPPSEDATFTNFVVFSPVLGGTVCSMGTMLNVAYSASLIGNGDDETIIGGTIGLASGKYLAVQDVKLNDLTITSGTLNIGNNVKVTGTTTAGVTGSGTSSIVLDENCLLDFSDQANNVPITGASISAVSGARVIPYGETESEAIIAGTGNAMNKYGKCGYLVSDASATTSANTLYDALVGGGTAYSNICFDPILDEQTIALVDGTTFSNAVTLNGNSKETTILNLGVDFKNTASVSFNNLTIAGGTTYCYVNDGFATSFDNCVVNITGASTSSGNDGIIYSSRIVGSTININTLKANSSYGRGYVFVTNANNLIKDSKFIGSCIGIYLYYNAVGSNSTRLIENCVFEVDNLWQGYGQVIISRQSADVWTTVRGCTFSDSVDNNGLSLQGKNTTGADYGAKVIADWNTFNNKVNVSDKATLRFINTNIINSTVSGYGTVEFADGATVTSTIPSGSTIGTGVISGCTVMCPGSYGSGGTVKLEGITLTGYTVAQTQNFRNPDLINVTMSNVTNASAGFLLYYNDGVKHTISNTTLTLASNLYALSCSNNGIVYITNSTFTSAIYLSSVYSTSNPILGTIILAGNVTVGAVRCSADVQSGNVYIISGSTITVGSITSTAENATMQGSVSVGTYVNDVWTPATTSDGMATVIANGHTVHVWGTGTYITNSGNTDLQHD